MGKGQIVTHYGAGHYRVRVVYGGRDRLTARIAILDDAIAALQTRIDAESDEYQKSLLTLEKKALEKSKQYLEDNFPDDYEQNMYCADRTEDLSGTVGTIEVPGESQFFNIQPGYDSNAVYASSRDGQLWPAIAGSAEWCFFNQSLLPGWQKHRPTYRYGRIVAGSIDNVNHICDICIDAAFSTQQSLNVNETSAIEGCPAYEHSGFSDFCSRNPTHPACTNTEFPSPLSVGEGLYAVIKDINNTVNSEHSYKTDASGWGVGDYWDIMGAGESGDCEDFALTKLQELYDYGVPVQNLQIATCYVERGLGYHAVLMIQTQNRGVLILDNRYDAVMTRDTLELLGYNFDLYQEAGHDWATFSTRLASVPIDYMDCNSTAFSDDDEVLIKFEDQEWDSPKVIGFRYSPEICRTAKIYHSLGQILDVNASRHIRYDTETDSWTIREDPYYLYIGSWWSATGMAHGTHCYLFGGEDFQNDNWYVLDEARKYYAIYNSWGSLDSFPGTNRGRSGGFVIGAVGYLVAGNNYPSGNQFDLDSTVFYNDVDSIDFSTNAWMTKNNFSAISDCDGVATIDGYAYIAGGATGEMQDGMPTVHNDNYRYDSTGDSFSSRNGFSGGRFNQAAFMANNKLHISGGLLSSKNFDGDLYGQWAGDDMWQTRNSQAYDHDANSWSTITQASTYEHRHYGAKNGIGTSGFISNPGGAYQNTYTMIYDASGGSWSYSKFTSLFWGADGVMYSA